MNSDVVSSLVLVNASLQSFIGTLQEEKETTRSESSEFHKSEFSQQLTSLCEVISHECTKVGMVFTDGGTPSTSACETLCNQLIGMSAALLKTATSLPDDVGVYFRRSVYKAIVDVFRSISALVNVVREAPKNTKEQLKEVGKVWESCDLLKAIPKDSRELLLYNMTKTANLVNDAFDEIQRLSADRIDELSDLNSYRLDASSIEREKRRLNACTQLIKAAKMTLSKSQSAIEQSKVDPNLSVSADDELTAAMEQISPSVDDVVCAFYEEEVVEELLLQEVSKLRDSLQEALLTFKKTPYYHEDAHGKWMGVLSTAVHHNFTGFCSTIENASKEMILSAF